MSADPSECGQLGGEASWAEAAHAGQRAGPRQAVICLRCRHYDRWQSLQRRLPRELPRLHPALGPRLTTLGSSRGPLGYQRALDRALAAYKPQQVRRWSSTGSCPRSCWVEGRSHRIHPTPSLCPRRSFDVHAGGQQKQGQDGQPVQQRLRCCQRRPQRGAQRR